MEPMSRLLGHLVGTELRQNEATGVVWENPHNPLIHQVSFSARLGEKLCKIKVKRWTLTPPV